MLAVPAHFKEEFMAETVRRGEKVVVKCQAFGDRPITITWKKDGQLLDKQAEKKLVLLFITYYDFVRNERIVLVLKNIFKNNTYNSE